MAIITTSVSPATIATALKRSTPTADEAAQWQLWIDDAVLLIQARVDSIAPEPTVDQLRIEYVVREAVVAQVRRPDDATQVTVSVDDASTSRTYRSSTGRVDILEQWWILLGLSGDGGRAYAVDTAPRRGRAGHLPWCDPAFGGLDCSCGAILTNHEYPLYEGGILSPSPDWWQW